MKIPAGRVGRSEMMSERDAEPMVDRRKGWLATVGLDRPELRAWAMYDWANSAMMTTIIAAVFPIYFSGVAGANLPKAVATQRFAIASTLGMVVIAILAPILGTIADAGRSRSGCSASSW
jgi:UMF1 family MFS transporter